jgi:sarcosine oxidase subunit gamma
MGNATRPIRRPIISSSTGRPNRHAAVTALTPAARFSLRMVPAEAAKRGAVAGFQLDLPINTCRLAGERLCARLGPDEWLLIAPEPDDDELRQTIAGEFADSLFALVDVGHRQVAFRVDGDHAADIVNGGCPLDLDDACFPAGSATRTLLGKAEIVLIRPGPARIYHVECGRSFAPYVHGFLNEVAREFGAVVPG